MTCGLASAEWWIDLRVQSGSPPMGDRFCPWQAEPMTDGSGIIDAAGVTKSWGATSVFSGLDVSVRPGVTGLLGSNGAGKTTLLGMVLGLHRPTSGHIRVLGENPSIAGPELRQRIGYSPEHHDLPQDMAAQDLVRHIAEVHGLPRREATTRSSDALWLVGLGEERARPVGTMSTGQRQRVKLAQAIAHDPDLVLLDEPTDGLDPVQRDDMLALIRRIGSEYGIDIVLSSHLLEEVERIADNVVILAGGRTVAAGPIDELRAGGGGMTVDVIDNVDAMLAALTSRGVQARAERERIQVASDTLDPAALALAVRDASVVADAPIRRLTSAEQSLEDLFLENIGATT